MAFTSSKILCNIDENESVVVCSADRGGDEEREEVREFGGVDEVRGDGNKSGAEWQATRAEEEVEKEGEVIRGSADIEEDN